MFSWFGNGSEEREQPDLESQTASNKQSETKSNKEPSTAQKMKKNFDKNAQKLAVAVGLQEKEPTLGKTRPSYYFIHTKVFCCLICMFRRR